MIGARRPRILLVDDNADDVELARLAFSGLVPEMELVVASDGVEALQLLRESGSVSSPQPMPELVLLDLNLPRLDGHEVLRRARADASTRLLPIVVMTSSREQQDVDRSYLLGANGYVQKPISYDSFVDAARSIVSYWLGCNIAAETGDHSER